jgi:peroxiredoxin
MLQRRIISFFCENKGLEMTLLSDPDFRVIRQFSALYPFNFIKRKLVFITVLQQKLYLKRLFSPYKLLEF